MIYFKGNFNFLTKKTKTVSSLENYQTSFCLTDLSNKRISLELTLKWDQIARLNLFRNGQGYIFQNPGVILKIVIQNRPWLFELECGKKAEIKNWNIFKKYPQSVTHVVAAISCWGLNGEERSADPPRATPAYPGANKPVPRVPEKRSFQAGERVKW